jgi:transposase-like protein
MAHSRSNHPSQRRYPPELRERAVRMVLETMEQTGQRVGSASARSRCAAGSARPRSTVAADPA